MTDNEETKPLETNCYTYEVTVVVQVLAPDKMLADARLESDGGYISERSVKFIRSTELYNSAVEELSRSIDKREKEESEKTSDSE